MDFGRIATKALTFLGTQVEANLRRVPPTPHVPGTGAPAPSVPVLYPCKCVISSDVSEFDENLVRGGDMSIVISAEDITTIPVEGDTVLLGALTYNVIKINSTFTGKLTAAMFTMLVRK